MTKLSLTPSVQLPVQPLPAPGSPPQGSSGAASSPPGSAGLASSALGSTGAGSPPPGSPGASAAKVSRPAPALDTAKIAKSANDFEAMAIGQLLQPMFDTVDSSKGKFGGGSGEEAWKPMLVQEFAKQISAHGGLGLAKPVYDAMLRMQQATPK